MENFYGSYRMLKMFLKPFGGRSFSNARILRNVEKEKNVVKSSETPETARPPGVRMDFVPSEFEKIILVLSGRYKNKESIPPRITYETMDNARSRFRIRGSNVLMVGTLFLCGYYVWKGKKRAREGESLNQIYLERDRKIIEEAKKARESLS